MNKLYLDFETRSEADLQKVGAYAYASHPSTDIICAGFAVNDGSVSVLTKSNLSPENWMDFRLVAHNVQFEYAIYHFVLHKKYGWPELLDPTRWDCTMARALTCGLPASLEGLAYALRLPFKKDLAGRSALLKICKPDARLGGKFNEDLALYEAVYKYNRDDVEVERAADKALPELTPEERKLFEKDLVINRRGMMIDLATCRRGVEIAAALTDDLNLELRTLTKGAVSKASRVAELKRWVASTGVKIPTKVTVDKETNEEKIKETLDVEAIKDLIKDPTTPELVKKVVGIRQQVGKSSVSKFQAMLGCACADGRFRGGFQYHGAHTGRWAGRLIQPTNFPQGFADPQEQEDAIALMHEGGAGWFKAVYNSRSMQTLSDILRACIIPSAGKVFVGGDLNAIECRVLNWLAGEEWVLALFARGESPYIRMAQGIYGRQDITKKGTPKEYDIGKRSELGCGFGMGWVRFQANVYTETSKRGEGVWLDDELAERAVQVYRQSHPRVISFWYGTEAAAIKAVRSPGQLFGSAGGRVWWGMSADRRFLCCKLPSGRLLRYFRPSVVIGKNRKDEPKDELRYWTSAGEGAIWTDANGFLGEYRTWGGELVENVVQAVARDIMVVGLLRSDDVVLHNYDELLQEIPVALGSEPMLKRVEELLDRMTKDLPSWTKGCPVAAEGWIGKRYRK